MLKVSLYPQLEMSPVSGCPYMVSCIGISKHFQVFIDPWKKDIVETEKMSIISWF